MILAATRAERSDLLRDAVLAALRCSGYRRLWSLECEVRDGQITLTGVLPSFYLKQVALTVAMRVEQVREVRNGIEVDPD